jgi:predicted type IV restriction endonuclease
MKRIILDVDLSNETLESCQIILNTLRIVREKRLYLYNLQMKLESIENTNENITQEEINKLTACIIVFNGLEAEICKQLQLVSKLGIFSFEFKDLSD